MAINATAWIDMEVNFAFMPVALNHFCFETICFFMCSQYIPVFGYNDVRVDMVIAARPNDTCVVDADNA